MNQTILSITDLQEERQLGALRTVYQTQATRTGKIVLLITGLVMVLTIAGVLALLVWLIVPDIGFPFFTPFFVLSTVSWPTLILGLAILAFWWQLRVHNVLATPLRRKIVVSLYEQGFVYCEGRTLHTVPWQQLRSVERLALPRKKQPRRYYKLTLEGATEITLPIVIAHLQELGAAIEEEMNKRQFPKILADYEAHKPVPFPSVCFTSAKAMSASSGIKSSRSISAMRA